MTYTSLECFSTAISVENRVIWNFFDKLSFIFINGDTNVEKYGIVA